MIKFLQKNKKVIFISLGLLIISGCATSASKLYSHINESSEYHKFGSADIIHQATALPLPATIHGLSFSRSSFELSPSDPVIDFGHYKSNYKLFSFNLKKNDKYVVDVETVCDCLGFDKRIVVPNAYIVDSSGHLVETTISNQGANLSAIGFLLHGTADHDGVYYLVFAANNSNPGESISMDQIMLNGYKPTGIMISNHSNPFGKIMPSYELSK